MKLTLKRAFWITDPTKLPRIDFDSAEAVWDAGMTTREDSEMANYGWFRVGDATVTLALSLTPDQMAVEGISRLQQAITKATAEHEAKMMLLHDAITKLSAIGWDGRP